MPSTKPNKQNRPQRSKSAKSPRKGSAPKLRSTTAESKKDTPRKGNANPTGMPGANSKQQQCLELLRRSKGASVEELQKLTGWQAHSVRGFLSGTVRRNLRLDLESYKVEGELRRYRIRQASA